MDLFEDQHSNFETVFKEMESQNLSQYALIHTIKDGHKMVEIFTVDDNGPDREVIYDSTSDH